MLWQQGTSPLPAFPACPGCCRGNGTHVLHSQGGCAGLRGAGGAVWAVLGCAVLPQPAAGAAWLMLLLCLVPVQLPERLELRTVLPHNLILEGVEFTVLQFQKDGIKKKLYFSNFGL